MNGPSADDRFIGRHSLCELNDETYFFPDHVLMTVVLVIGLGACGGSDSPDAPPPSSGAPSTVQPPPAQPPPAQEHGYFVGTVRIGSQEYYGDASVTVDGAVRLYVGGPEAGDAGAGLIRRTTESFSQFIGELEWQRGQAVGSGFIIGQGCGAASRFGSAAKGHRAKSASQRCRPFTSKAHSEC